MKILVLDNYDSFTYNLVHSILRFDQMNVDVIRNDKIDLNLVNQYEKIVLSPGPGIPNEANLLKPLIERYAPHKSILGVCLGQQAIAEVFGGKIFNTKKVFHGVATTIKVLLRDDALFRGLPDELETGRYHSWAVSRENFPDELEITAVGQEEEIMALRHKFLDVRGVQFHPESILTPLGDQIIENWLFS